MIDFYNLLFMVLFNINTPWKRSLLYQLMCVQETHSDSFNETLLEERGWGVLSQRGTTRGGGEGHPLRRELYNRVCGGGGQAADGEGQVAAPVWRF